MRTATAVLVCALAGGAGAEERPHALYLELLGKGGLGGVGYDLELSARYGAGAAASFYVLDDQRILSFSPYASIRLLGDACHRWFVHAGPQVARVAVRSPVPEWPGTTSTGVGAELSSGWEYRNRVLVRVYAMAAAGRGGVQPWIGVSVGWTR
jgi:hypothetical protein